MTCPVCLRRVDPAKIRKTLIRARLHGWVRYGICKCGMEAEDVRDRGYVSRWKQAYRRAFSAPVTRGISRKKRARNALDKKEGGIR